MSRKVLGVLFALVLPTLGLAQFIAPVTYASSGRVKTVRDDCLVEQGSYVNANGNVIHRPAHTVSGAAPTGATAECRDGPYSFSQNHRGTCSRHGGVGVWL
ncbi:DUF3761 domain-containing protein [Pinirhizobacter soli]|uniref:DUF3761 domain-containing protein n=1 Tax=Pinirhizobacter soli TaxID=2786953 RepID=UPI003CCD7D2C